MMREDRKNYLKERLEKMREMGEIDSHTYDGIKVRLNGADKVFDLLKKRMIRPDCVMYMDSVIDTMLNEIEHNIEIAGKKGH